MPPFQSNDWNDDDFGLFGIPLLDYGDDCPKRPERNPVPLVGVKVKGEVLDFVGEIQLVQCYHNTNNYAIEAVYNFPVDEAAAVCGFRAEYEDGTTVVGIVEEKQKAKQQYQKAVREGKQANLLETVRRDILSLNVGNIPPNGYVKITITYVTILKARNDAAALVLPTYIAPRYTPISSLEGDADFPSTTSGILILGLDVEVNVTCRSQIKRIASPTHEYEQSLATAWEGKNGRLSLQNIVMDSDLVIHIEENECHQPRVIMEVSKEDNSVNMTGFVTFFPQIEFPNQKREFVFLIDRSGSMSGKKTEQASQALLLFLRSLPPSSTFNIVGFGSSYESLFASPQPYNDTTLDEATRYARNMRANLGGTEIFAPLREIFAQPLAVGMQQRQVLVLTDGQVSNDLQIFDLIRSNCSPLSMTQRQQEAVARPKCRLFCVGIGEGVSRHLVEGMARAGRGTSRFVEEGNPGSLRVKILGQLKQSMQPALEDVSVEWQFPRNKRSDTSETELQSMNPPPVKTLLGYRSPAIDRAPPPSQQQPKMFPNLTPPIFNKERFLSFAMFQPNSVMPESVKVSCQSEDGPLEVTLNITAEETFQGSVARKLAARTAISEYEENRKSRNNAPRKKRTWHTTSPTLLPLCEISQTEALQLAMENNLLSEQTSFVAIRKEARHSQREQPKVAETTAGKEEEQRRIAREQKQRQIEKEKKIQCEMENMQMQKLLAAMGHNTKAMTEEQAAKMDTGKLTTEHTDMLSKKREAAERMAKESAEQMDHLVRAIRIEELSLVKAQHQEKVQQDQARHRQVVDEKMKQAKTQWEEDVHDREVLSSFSVFDHMENFEAKVMEGRRETAKPASGRGRTWAPPQRTTRTAATGPRPKMFITDDDFAETTRSCGVASINNGTDGRTLAAEQRAGGNITTSPKMEGEKRAADMTRASEWLRGNETDDIEDDDSLLGLEPVSFKRIAPCMGKPSTSGFGSALDWLRKKSTTGLGDEIDESFSKPVPGVPINVPKQEKAPDCNPANLPDAELISKVPHDDAKPTQECTAESYGGQWEYNADGGVHHPQREGEWSRPTNGGWEGTEQRYKYNCEREVKTEPEVVDNRKQRLLTGLGDCAVFDLLDGAERTGGVDDVRPGAPSRKAMGKAPSCAPGGWDDGDEWDLEDDALDAKPGIENQEQVNTFDDEEDEAITGKAASDKAKHEENKRRGTEHLDMTRKQMEYNAEMQANMTPEECRMLERKRVEEADNALTDDLFSAVDGSASKMAAIACNDIETSPKPGGAMRSLFGLHDNVKPGNESQLSADSQVKGQVRKSQDTAEATKAKAKKLQEEIFGESHRSDEVQLVGDVMDLCMLQRADGSFVLNGLSKAVGVTQDTLNAIRALTQDSVSVVMLEPNAFATALAVAAMREWFSKQREVWELQEEKAVMFLTSCFQHKEDMSCVLFVIQLELRRLRGPQVYGCDDDDDDFF